jgi:hypothetical protein
VTGRLWHRPHLNGAGPWVVRSGRRRDSGELVALVLSIASVMGLACHFCPSLVSGGGGPAAEGGGVGTLATKAEVEVLAVRCATFIS